MLYYLRPVNMPTSRRRIIRKKLSRSSQLLNPLPLLNKRSKKKSLNHKVIKGGVGDKPQFGESTAAAAGNSDDTPLLGDMPQFGESTAAAAGNSDDKSNNENDNSDDKSNNEKIQFLRDMENRMNKILIEQETLKSGYEQSLKKTKESFLLQLQSKDKEINELEVKNLNQKEEIIEIKEKYLTQLKKIREQDAGVDKNYKKKNDLIINLNKRIQEIQKSHSLELESKENEISELTKRQDELITEYSEQINDLKRKITLQVLEHNNQITKIRESHLEELKNIDNRYEDQLQELRKRQDELKERQSKQIRDVEEEAQVKAEAAAAAANAAKAAKAANAEPNNLYKGIESEVDRLTIQISNNDKTIKSLEALIKKNEDVHSEELKSVISAKDYMKIDLDNCHKLLDKLKNSNKDALDMTEDLININETLDNTKTNKDILDRAHQILTKNGYTANIVDTPCNINSLRNGVNIIVTKHDIINDK